MLCSEQKSDHNWDSLALGRGLLRMSGWNRWFGGQGISDLDDSDSRTWTWLDSDCGSSCWAIKHRFSQVESPNWARVCWIFVITDPDFLLKKAGTDLEVRRQYLESDSKMTFSGGTLISSWDRSWRVSTAYLASQRQKSDSECPSLICIAAFCPYLKKLIRTWVSQSPPCLRNFAQS